MEPTILSVGRFRLNLPNCQDPTLEHCHNKLPCPSLAVCATSDEKLEKAGDDTTRPPTSACVIPEAVEVGGPGSHLISMSNALTSSISSLLQSACAVCVGVGSFSDPPDIPGLVHLLEHSESAG